jgi:3-isopropylmalate/(R)-2-methylmalate dehydratase large subunit
MPMTISEKILAAPSDHTEATPGDLIQARLDFVFANAITGPVSIRVLKAIRPSCGSY